MLSRRATIIKRSLQEISLSLIRELFKSPFEMMTAANEICMFNQLSKEDYRLKSRF